MSDETLIADLVLAGLAPELIGRVSNAIAAATLEGVSRTMSRTNDETVRTYERRRKREQRGKSAKPEANDAGVEGQEVPAIPPKCPGHVPDIGKNAVNLLTNLSSLSISNSSLERTASKEEYVEGRDTKKGRRITRDWRPATETTDWCRREHGLVGVHLENFIAEFIDYWDGIPGQRGRKSNWEGTFRNRVREKVGKMNGKHRQGTLTDMARELADEARELERQAGLHRSTEPF